MDCALLASINYNQTVKTIKIDFSERRALVLLRQFEKATFKLGVINRKVIKMTREFGKNYEL